MVRKTHRLARLALKLLLGLQRIGTQLILGFGGPKLVEGERPPRLDR